MGFRSTLLAYLYSTLLSRGSRLYELIQLSVFCVPNAIFILYIVSAFFISADIKTFLSAAECAPRTTKLGT